MLLTVHPITVRWRQPFSNAYVSQEAFTTTIVVVHPEGGDGDREYGIGEAAPSYFGTEDARTVAAAYERVRRSGALDDIDPDTPSTWHGCLSILADEPAAHCGLEMALLDLAAKRRMMPLRRWWNLPAGGPSGTYLTVALADGPQLDAWLDWAAGLGGDRLKVKVANPGREPDRAALLRLATVRDRFPAAELRVDPNASWQLTDALRLVPALRELAVSSMEEPLTADAPLDDLRRLREASGIAVFGDEHCIGGGPRVDGGYYDGLVVKPGTLGGLNRARHVIEAAHQRGLQVTLGCNAETGVAIGASAQLAPMVESLDLDSALLTLDDPFESVTVTDGVLHLPLRPGLGVRRRSA
jgi:L-alanine-DL-glutamate epimerase-like enolase superfamily enzyme